MTRRATMLDALRISAARTMVWMRGVRGSEEGGPGGREEGSTPWGKVGGEVREARISSWGRVRFLERWRAVGILGGIVEEEAVVVGRVWRGGRRRGDQPWVGDVRRARMANVLFGREGMMEDFCSQRLEDWLLLSILLIGSIFCS